MKVPIPADKRKEEGVEKKILNSMYILGKNGIFSYHLLHEEIGL